MYIYKELTVIYVSVNDPRWVTCAACIIETQKAEEPTHVHHRVPRSLKFGFLEDGRENFV